MARWQGIRRSYHKFKIASVGCQMSRPPPSAPLYKDLLTLLSAHLDHFPRDAIFPGSRVIVSACCSTEDVMIQLVEGDRSPEVRPDAAEAPLPSSAPLTDPVASAKGQEPDEPVWFISPPAPPWPRVFPPL